MKSLIVTGAHHRAVLELLEKSQELERAHFQAEVATQRDRAEKSENRVQELHAKLLDLMTTREERVEQARTVKRRNPEPLKTNFDPNDPAQLFQQARQETGSSSASRILRRMEQIRQRIPREPGAMEMGRPNQGDVQRMIDNAEFQGLTMDEVPIAPAPEAK
jgi:hypothetical protein